MPYYAEEPELAGRVRTIWSSTGLRPFSSTTATLVVMSDVPRYSGTRLRTLDDFEVEVFIVETYFPSRLFSITGCLFLKTLLGASPRKISRFLLYPAPQIHRGAVSNVAFCSIFFIFSPEAIAVFRIKCLRVPFRFLFLLDSLAYPFSHFFSVVRRDIITRRSNRRVFRFPSIRNFFFFL